MELTDLQMDALKEWQISGLPILRLRSHSCSIPYPHECAEINIVDIAEVGNFLPDELTTLVVFELQG